MRITYIHQYFNTPSMAGATRSYEMARRLVAMGHEVNMITSCRSQNSTQRFFESEEAGIQVHWAVVPYANRMTYRQRIHAFVRFALAASGKAARLPADVVFATSTPLTVAMPGAYSAWRQCVPMVFEVRDLWPELPIAMGALRTPISRYSAKWLERFAYSRAARVVALSPGMRDGVLRRGVPEDRVAVIPNSADLDLFDVRRGDPQRFRDAHPELGDEPLIVYTGAMGTINGVGYLPRIAAAARARSLKAQFAVIGHGREEQTVRAEAQRLGVLGRNFHMYPSVPKSEMPDVLAAATVATSLFIDLEAMWANSANKFFDALASGTAVAINYGGWHAELLRTTGAGIVMPPDDPGRAAEELDAFLADPSRVREAGHRARRLAEERFDRDQLARELESVLRHAAQPDPTGGATA